MPSGGSGIFAALLREKLRLPANPTVAKIEKTETEKKKVAAVVGGVHVVKKKKK